MHRQSSLVFMIGQPKKLLKELGIENRYQKVKGRIIIRNDGKQSDLFLSDRSQIQFIGDGQLIDRIQIELFQSSCQSNLNAL